MKFLKKKAEQGQVLTAEQKALVEKFTTKSASSKGSVDTTKKEDSANNSRLNSLPSSVSTTAVDNNQDDFMSSSLFTRSHSTGFPLVSRGLVPVSGDSRRRPHNQSRKARCKSISESRQKQEKGK